MGGILSVQRYDAGDSPASPGERRSLVFDRGDSHEPAFTFWPPEAPRPAIDWPDESPRKLRTRLVPTQPGTLLPPRNGRLLCRLVLPVQWPSTCETIYLLDRKSTRLNSSHL